MAKKSNARANRALKILIVVIFFIGITVGVTGSLLVSVLSNRSRQVSATPEIVVAEDDVESVRAQAEEDAVLNDDDENASAPEEFTKLDEKTKDALKTLLESGTSVTKTLRTLYPEDLVIMNSGQYHFVPINSSLQMHNLKQENLVWVSDKEMQYQENGTAVSHKGIDVSRYQGTIDWEKVKNAGVEFAFIRAGIRGYETGKIVPDDSFYQNAVSASSQGIGVGAYIFSQAVNAEEAVEEADVVINSLSGNEIAYPIVYDLEYIKSSKGRMHGMSKEDITIVCRAFCDHVKEAGYTPMIYGNIETFGLMLNMDKLEDIDKWFAGYSSELYFPYKFSIWQYTQKGAVDGIDGDVDMNLSFE